MKIQFKEWPCILEKGKYQNNGRTALELIHETEGDPVAVARMRSPLIVVI